MGPCIAKHACAAAALLFALFYQLSLAAPYEPIDNILIDCGASSQVKDQQQRNWVGDISSQFFPLDLHQNAESVTLKPSNLVDKVPYMTTRLSRSEFTYSIPVSPGQKFVRLYFNPGTYSPIFGRSKAVFSVRIGLYTLLRDFSASLYADASNLYVFFREFCVSVDGNETKLNLTFIPTNSDSYAFVNGIEIVSMPSYLYHTPPQSNERGIRGLKFIGQNNIFFPVENNTFLEMVYRMNIGGRTISPGDDTGMFRTWSEEQNLVLRDNVSDARPANLSIMLDYTKVSPYTAPEDVYRTARTMGPNATENKKYNLTWEFPIDPGFFYLIRLHFCEFQSEINDTNDRVFIIYIKHMITESSADVFRWAGGKGSPYYRDYVVLVSSNNVLKKVNLSVELQPYPNDVFTRFSNVILNGVEIFKLNDSIGNLGAQNPNPPVISSTILPLPPLNTRSENLNRKIMVIVISVAISGMVVILAISSFLFWRWRISHDQTSSHGTLWWIPFSIPTSKSSKTHNTNLPSSLWRYFSLGLEDLETCTMVTSTTEPPKLQSSD